MSGYCECPDCGAYHGRSFDHPVRCGACCAREMTEEQYERALRPLRDALGMPSRPRTEVIAAAVRAVQALQEARTVSATAEREQELSSKALQRAAHSLRLHRYDPPEPWPDGVAVAVWQALSDIREQAAALDRISAALAVAGYSHQPDNAAPGHRSAAEVAECVEMALADTPAALARASAALWRISNALTATGREADACGHTGPTNIADAAEEALADLSARWRTRDEALEQIREAMGMAPSSPADVGRIAVQMIRLYRQLGGRRHADHLPDAPADGGDCGGEHA